MQKNNRRVIYKISKYAIDFGHGVGSDRGTVGFIDEEDIINAVGTLVLVKVRLENGL